MNTQATHRSWLALLLCALTLVGVVLVAPTSAHAQEAGTSATVDGEERTFDLRLEMNIFSREAIGRVSGGLAFGFNIHHAVALDARLSYGDGREASLEWLSTALGVRVRPLRFLDGSNLAGSLAVQTGYELFFGTDVGDAALLDFLIGFEYRTPSGAHFLALAGPALLFMDATEYQDAWPEARVGFGYSF